MTSRVEHPDLIPDAETLALLADLRRQGLASTTAVVALVAEPLAEIPAAFHVSGGLNAFCRTVEAFRVHPGTLVRLRDAQGVEEGLLDLLRDLRGRVDVLGIAEGEIIFPGEPMLELHGALADALLLLPAARLLLGLGTAAATGAALQRALAPEGDLLHAPPEDEAPLRLEMAALGARIAGWTGTTCPRVSACSGLRMLRGSDLVPELLRDPLDPALSPRAAPRIRTEILATGPCAEILEGAGMRRATSARLIYRRLGPDGTALEDRVVPRGTPRPADARSILERFCDIGHVCRPLPDPARAEGLFARSSEELGGLPALADRRKPYPVLAGEEPTSS